MANCDVTRYKKTTDVQATWREHGWVPPSEDPTTVEKWRYYRTLDTQTLEVTHGYSTSPTRPDQDV